MIAQLTDLHVGMTIDRDYVARVVAQVNAIGADVIAVPSLPGELEHDWCLDSLADPELLAWVESLPAR